MIERTKVNAKYRENKNGVTVKDIPPRSFFFCCTDTKLWYKINDHEIINFETESYLSPLSYDNTAVPVKEVTITINI